MQSFKLERLNYIYSQLKFHNEGVYKDFGIFVKIVTAILGAGVAIIAKRADLGRDTVSLGMRSLLWIAAISGALVSMSVLCHILSWIDYRREEASVLNAELGIEYRSQPNIWHSWRWRETYVFISIPVLVGLMWFVSVKHLIPMVLPPK